MVELFECCLMLLVLISSITKPRSFKRGARVAVYGSSFKKKSTQFIERIVHPKRTLSTWGMVYCLSYSEKGASNHYVVISRRIANCDSSRARKTGLRYRIKNIPFDQCKLIYLKSCEVIRNEIKQLMSGREEVSAKSDYIKFVRHQFKVNRLLS